MLRLIIGPARSGKTGTVMREIAGLDALERVFYLVPEQMTLAAQQALLDAVPGHGVMNTEVLSFNRFAHRIFEEVGLPARKVLDDVGKSLVLYRIVNRHKDELEYYGSSVRQSGFIGQLKLALTEMLQYCLEEEKIREVLERNLPDESVLRKKWNDVLLVLRDYREEISGERISSEQLLDLLAARLSSSKTARGARFYFDEFSGFTPQQYRVLGEILRAAKDVTVCLTMSERAYGAYLRTAAGEPVHKNAFSETQKTARKLEELARSLGIPCERVFQRPKEESGNARVLRTLRESLFDAREPVLPMDLRPAQTAVYASRFGSCEEEIRAMLREILHLVREEGLRLRDIAVVPPSAEEFEYPLIRAFELYGLGSFLDNKTNVTSHPFAQLILQALAGCESDFSENELPAMLKTGLTALTPDECDLFENEMLAAGLRGGKELSAALRAHEDWEGASALAEALTALRAAQKGEKSVSDRLRSLQAFLEALGVPARMDSMAEALERESVLTPGAAPRYLRRAAEYRQLPGKFRELCESTESFLSDMVLGLRDFVSLITVGLSQYRLSTVPPSSDQLVAGDLSSTRLGGVKVLFVPGFSESSFPGETDNPGLFNRRERSRMSSFLEMAPDAEENAARRYLQLYCLLGKVSDRVYFSMSAMGRDGRSVPSSLLWDRIRKAVDAKPWPKRDGLTLPLPALCEEGLSLPERAREWLRANGYGDCLDVMEEARARVFRQERISPETAQALLGGGVPMFSVSQMETYAGCPLSYYLQYMLRLRDRDSQEVRVYDDGNVLHEILERSGELLQTIWKERNEKILSDEEVERRVAGICDALDEEGGYKVYKANSRYRYFWRKLQESAGEAVKLIRDQLSNAEFEPTAFEWEFGGKGNEPVTLELPDGRKVRFKGKIDRIDLLRENGKEYLRVVDYKSSDKQSFDPAQALAGLQLQLPVYLDTALGSFDSGTPAAEKKPAGFFYYHLFAEEAKEARLDGVMLDEDGIRVRMEAENGPDFCKDKVGEQSLRALGAFARRTMSGMAEKICAGEIGASPIRTSKDQGSCTYCGFRGVCGFDEKLPGAVMRALPDASDFWERIENSAQDTAG